ncbi:TGS domain-containing protein [Candidatus Caldatribacterium sp.]|uniref:TGS domain-containing protein n=1 Tax=Candidatus Caldatribacterium sp. TaxID=2282143 RepID=UPI00383FA85D|nr:TGS domain-containing protein [Candidatus Caldatribacterium sp.]
MPANLPPQYFEVEARYRAAKTPEEKLEALEEMLAVIPKHKGTEKLQAEIKQKIAKLRKAQAQEKRKGAAHDPFLIEKSGAAQIIICGPPNTGKSTLLSLLTNARPEIAEYPFTTFYPTPGMMDYEDIQIQLVDFPPLSGTTLEGPMASAFRRSNGAVILFDAQSNTLLEDIENTLHLFSQGKILPGTQPLPLPSPSWHFLPAFLILSKVENKEAEEQLSIVAELYGDRFDVLGVSLRDFAPHRDKVKAALFRISGVIRIYSKPPGKPPDFSRPFVLKKGSTVADLAGAIHKDLLAHLRGARVWGSTKFPGQLVPPDYVLQDKDVVEIRTS